MKQFILDRLNEPSTWRGIILILTSAGVNIAPAMADAIIGAGIGICGLVGVLTADKPKAEKAENQDLAAF
jgi:hypothetical protein